ncbi:MAG: HD domain-containing protein [Candidatus Krumholzibacteriia bacterium]
MQPLTGRLVDMPDPSQDLKRIAHFLFEVGMLKRTPRTGLQFLGSGTDSVAEHILRTTYLAYTLGRLVPEVDRDRLLLLCLLHDLPEARTGDLNYQNKKYVQVDEEAAMRDLARTLPFGDEMQALLAEFNERKTLEARLANDCDQLELVLLLKEERDRGNPQADEWIPFALKRLQEPMSERLAQAILDTHSSDWWFEDRGDWWVWAGKDAPDPG